MANQTYRVLEIIKRFNNNEKVCISQLQNETMWYGKSDKTIRRDLDIIKESFADSFHLIAGEQGCYKAITNELMDNIINPESISMLVQTFNIAQRSNLFDDLNINRSDKKILQKKIKESKKIYLFKNKPFENSSADMALFKKLEQAVYHKKELCIEYQTRHTTISQRVRPYKIVFMNENFYLACEVEQKAYSFSLFRISKIHSAEFTKQTFHQNREIVSFITDMQTPMARYRTNYKEHLVEVIVEVNSQKAHYFKAKKHLTSQKIIEEKKDGTLLLCFTVTQILEIEEMILKWIPHMRVVSPLSLKESIEKRLEKYLKS